MAQLATKAKRGGKEASERTEEVRSQAEDTASDAAPESTDDDRRDEGSGGSESDATTLTSELKSVAREAAIEVLRPVVRKATTSAAKYAVTKGPGLVKDRVAPKLEDAGGAGGLLKGVTSKGGGVAEAVGGVASGLGGKLGLGGGGKKEGEKEQAPSGTGRGRRLPVQEFVDVGADLQTTYDQFTQFEDWPKFMHRVERIEQRDDSTLMWHENIWGVRRSWEAEILEQTPCERIVWRSKGGTQSIGVVTFHRLSDRLTRIYITMDFQPKGLFEKTASGMRISRRALRSDLMRFKAFVELRDEATGEWRGRIEEGEVVDEEQPAEETEDREEPQGEEDEEQPEASEDEEDEEQPRAEEEDEEEDEEQPQASEDEEDYEEEDEEQPRAEEEDEEEDEYADEEGEPRAAADDEEEEDEEEEEARGSAEPEEEDEAEDEEARPRRRRSRAPAGGRTASGRSGRGAH